MDNYLVRCVAGFCDRLSPGDVELKSDSEETLIALKEQVATLRKKEKGDAVRPFVTEESIEDSASMGSVE